MSTLKPIGVQYVKSRIVKLAKTPPAKPLTGRGYDRRECLNERVFGILERLAPSHCAKVSQREAINSFGRIGYPKHNYVSLELSEVITANVADFDKLEAAMNLVAKFNL